MDSKYRPLNNIIESPSPSWHGGNTLAFRMDLGPINLATTRVDVDLAGAKPALPLPGEAADPEEYDNGHGKVGFEETLGIVDATTWWADGYVELKRQGVLAFEPGQEE